MAAAVMAHLFNNGMSVPEVITTRSGAQMFGRNGMAAVPCEITYGEEGESGGRFMELSEL